MRDYSKAGIKGTSKKGATFGDGPESALEPGENRLDIAADEPDAFDKLEIELFH